RRRLGSLSSPTSSRWMMLNPLGAYGYARHGHWIVRIMARRRFLMGRCWPRTHPCSVRSLTPRMREART
ncbi:hypothetical protein DXG01_014086, partial [Tephrocybe rancida]